MRRARKKFGMAAKGNWRAVRVESDLGKRVGQGPYSARSSCSLFCFVFFVFHSPFFARYSNGSLSKRLRTNLDLKLKKMAGPLVSPQTGANI